ncbi:uncharacterized protein LOC135078473 [Ostrinia nubilalis]|uniref:uncharacterized protein LOC135078473 n=1 Tax=Ostrinia nubilalis TaxID=29057 RepID=UPI0030822792
MDLTRVVQLFLIHLMSLGLNSAESGETDVAPHDTTSDEFSTPNIPSRFSWGYSNGSSTPSERRDPASAEADDDEDPQARVLYWIPTTCDSLSERGYTCVGCGESLHCMAGNFALKAICYGRRPYCYNGVCSYIRGEKCQKEGLETAQTDILPNNATITDEIQPAVSNVDAIEGSM